MGELVRKGVGMGEWGGGWWEGGGVSIIFFSRLRVDYLLYFDDVCG